MMVSRHQPIAVVTFACGKVICTFPFAASVISTAPGSETDVACHDPASPSGVDADTFNVTSTVIPVRVSGVPSVGLFVVKSGTFTSVLSFSNSSRGISEATNPPLRHEGALRPQQFDRPVRDRVPVRVRASPRRLQPADTGRSGRAALGLPQ